MLASIVFLLLAFLEPISCWGGLGHRTVAYLAEKYFTDGAVHFVNDLLENDQGFDISDAALFADKIRHRRPWTAQWHFIDAKDDPPNSCGVNYRRDCNNDGVPGCVISAITNFTHVVLDSSEDPTTRKEALMFLIHFIGDIHQPLHTEDASRGGTRIPVEFDGRHENLHAIWDTNILHKYRNLPHELSAPREKIAAARWAEEIFGSSPEKSRRADSDCQKGPECSDINQAQKCALGWATESNCRICTNVLKPGIDWIEDNDLGGSYYEDAVPVVVELISKAGFRLGAWINALAAAHSAGVELVVQDDGKDGEFPHGVEL